MENTRSSPTAARSRSPTIKNRYSSFAEADELDNWHNTFKAFDRDGAGDINHHEIGLLFLQLGFRPTQAEIDALVSEVDNNSSGTVDFEEFCLLMLRLKRQPLIPEWLRKIFFPPDEDEAPEVALLSQTHKRNGIEVETGLHPPLSREMFFYVADLLPLCETLLTLKLSGFGDAFGPFVAEELAIGLGRSNRTLKTLELAYNAIGDVGAESFARALRQNFTITSLDIAGNGIGVTGAQALLESIAPPPLPAPPLGEQNRDGSRRRSQGKGKSGGKGTQAGSRPQCCSLRVLNLDDNALPPTLLGEVAARLLLLELPRTFASQLEAPELPAPAATHAALAALTLDGLAADAVVRCVAPAVTVSSEAMSSVHAASLHAHAMHHSLASLSLLDCSGMGEAGGRAFFLDVTSEGDGAAADTQGIWSGARSSVRTLAAVRHQQLTHLRLSACNLGNEAVLAFADFVQRGSVPALACIALDGNQITLQESPKEVNPPAAAECGWGPPQVNQVGLSLAEALLSLPHLTAVDLSANPLHDDAAAILCRVLLASASLDLLHLAGTQAGDASAVACAAALGGTRDAPSKLRVLSLSGGVRDAGAARLAAVLPACASLQELWLGGTITDEGAEQIARSLRDPAARLRSLALGGTLRGGVTIRNQLTERAATAFAETCMRANGCLAMLRLSGNSGIGGGGCVHLLKALQASSSLRALHIDGCGLTRAEVPLLIEALQASVWCLHELRLEYDAPGTRLSLGSHPPHSSPHASRPPLAAGECNGGLAGEGSGKLTSLGECEGKKLLSLQQRLQLAKLLEDNRVMGRRRVDSWRLSRSLEEVAHVFNSYCANIRESAVEGGLEMWGGADCAQFVRNVGLPQYDACFERNLTGAKLQWLQMSHLAQLGVVSFAHQKEVMHAVRLLLHAYARKEAVAHTMGQWDLLLGRKLAKKDKRRQQKASEAQEAARLRAVGAAVHRAERAGARPRKHTVSLESVALPHVLPPPDRIPPLAPMVGLSPALGHVQSEATRPSVQECAPPSQPQSLPLIPHNRASPAKRDWVGFLSPFAGSFQAGQSAFGK